MVIVIHRNTNYQLLPQVTLAIILYTLSKVGQRWLGGKGSPPVAGFTVLWPDSFVACFQEFIKILGKDGTHKISTPQAFRLGGWQAKECIIITLAWSPAHPTKPYHHQLTESSHLIRVLEWRVALSEG